MTNSSLPDTIWMTPSAASKIYGLMKEENNLSLKLRVFVVGGGCSGVQYGFSFTEEVNEDDFSFVQRFLDPELSESLNTWLDALVHLWVQELSHPLFHNRTVLEGVVAYLVTLSQQGERIHLTTLVDAQSFYYLKGAEVDYRQDIQGEQFIIRNNPNAKTTCGCGSSFSIDE